MFSHAFYALINKNKKKKHNKTKKQKKPNHKLILSTLFTLSYIQLFDHVCFCSLECPFYFSMKMQNSIDSSLAQLKYIPCMKNFHDLTSLMFSKAWCMY